MRAMHSPRYREVVRGLCAARVRAGLTQTAAGRALGQSQSWMSKVESGERRVDVVELVDLAALYRCAVGSLLPRPRALRRPGRSGRPRVGRASRG